MVALLASARARPTVRFNYLTLRGRAKSVSSSFSQASLSSSTTDNNVSGSDKKSAKINASSSEVNKFSSFASHWWDSRSNPLVGMNPVRVKFIRDVVNGVQAHHVESDASNGETEHLVLHNKKVLDIGCGGGLLTESLSRLGASLVVGVDASSKVVDVARVHSFHASNHIASIDKNNSRMSNHDGGNTNIKYFGGSTIEEFAVNWQSEQHSGEIPREQFDIITALEIVEHVPNPSSLLKAATSLLKPNGILFVSTINRTIKSYGLAIVAAEYITGKVPIGTHNWKQFFSPKEIEMIICRDNSMKQIALSGMVLRPPFVNMQWSLNPTDMDINWIGAYQKTHNELNE